MKRDLFGLIVLLVIILVAVLCSCNTTEQPNKYITTDSVEMLNDSIIRNAMYNYAEQLIKDGYSTTWAYHKAMVEYGVIEIDSLYIAIEED